MQQSQHAPWAGRLAVATLAMGLIALVTSFAFPISVTLIEQFPLPPPPVLELIGSVLAFLVAVAAVASGHLAVARLPRVDSRPRQLSWAGLAMGYAALAQLAVFEFLFRVHLSPY